MGGTYKSCPYSRHRGIVFLLPIYEEGEEKRREETGNYYCWNLAENRD